MIFHPKHVRLFEKTCTCCGWKIVLLEITVLIFILKPNLCDEMDVRERLIVQKLRNGDQDMIRI